MPGWFYLHRVTFRHKSRSALRTVQLAEGYENLSEIISGYDDAVASFNSEREHNEEQARLLRQEQKLDLERKRAQRRLKK